MLPLQSQNFTFAKFKYCCKTSVGSKARISHYSFSSVTLKQGMAGDPSMGGSCPIVSCQVTVWQISLSIVCLYISKERYWMKYTKCVPEIISVSLHAENSNLNCGLVFFPTESSWNADFGASEFTPENEMEKVCTTHVFYVMLFLFPIQRNTNVSFLPQAEWKWSEYSNLISANFTALKCNSVSWIVFKMLNQNQVWEYLAVVRPVSPTSGLCIWKEKQR